MLTNWHMRLCQHSRLHNDVDANVHAIIAATHGVQQNYRPAASTRRCELFLAPSDTLLFANLAVITIPKAQPESSHLRERVIAQATVIALALLYVLNVAAFPQAALVTDSGRDIANAWLIAQGEHFPLTGPDIYGTWKLGPIWFYFLSIPLLLGGSLTTVAIWIGVFASLKIPLAFLLGRRCYGLAGGLGFAAAIAMPGWSSAGALVLAHTCLIETMVLGSILVSWWAMRMPTIGRLSIATLMLALAMHAHPTAVVVAPWLLAALWRGIRNGSHGAAIGAAAAAFSLPWLPMLYAESLAGWPQLWATQSYLQQQTNDALPEQALAALRGLITGWPSLLSDFLWPAAARLGQGIAAVWFGLLTLAGIGLLIAARRTNPRFTWLLVLQSVFALLLICMLRPHAPIYMYFALFPLLTWVLIHGWNSALGPRVGALFFFASLAAVAAIAQTGSLLQRSSYLAQGWVPIPAAAFDDVAAEVANDGVLRFWLSAKDQQGAVSAFCSRGWALHGELATALSLGSNVAIHRACAANKRPQIGGRNAQQHAVGLPLFVAQRLRVSGSQLVPGWISAAPAEVLFPDVGQAASVDAEYAVLRYAQRAQPVTTHSVSAACAADHIIAVTNFMPGLNALEAVATSTSGTGTVAITPILTTLAAAYFPCATARDVLLTIKTTDPSAVDIFTLRTGL